MTDDKSWREKARRYIDYEVRMAAKFGWEDIIYESDQWLRAALAELEAKEAELVKGNELAAGLAADVDAQDARLVLRKTQLEAKEAEIEQLKDGSHGKALATLAKDEVVSKLALEISSLRASLDRWIAGEPIEGDYVTSEMEGDLDG